MERHERSKTRSGRVLLTREAIAEAALAFVDEHGLDELSTRKLAGVLGIEAMSLYHHFATKAALLDAVSERLTLRLELPAVDPTGDVIGQFVSASRGLYALAAKHPRAFPLLVLRRANTRRTMQVYDSIVAPLLAAKLPPADAALVFRATGYFTMGAALARIATFGTGEDATRPPLEDPETASTLSNLRAVAPYMTTHRFDALYERGLDALVAGLRVEIATPKRSRPSKTRSKKTGRRTRDVT